MMLTMTKRTWCSFSYVLLLWTEAGGTTSAPTSAPTEQRYGQTAWDIMEGRSDVSLFWEIVQNAFVDPRFDQFRVPLFVGDFPYPINSGYLERVFWLQALTAFVPNNDAVMEFAPFGEDSILKSKILEREWLDHAFHYAFAHVNVQDFPAKKIAEIPPGYNTPGVSALQVDAAATPYAQVNTEVFPTIIANILEKDLNEGNQVFDYGLFSFNSSGFRLPAFVNVLDKVRFFFFECKEMLD